MIKKAKCLLAFLVGLSLVMSACGPAQPVEPTPTQTDPNAVFTAAAETADAMMTEQAQQEPTPEPATPTFTSPPPSPTIAAATSVVTATVTSAPTIGAGVGTGTGTGASAQGDNSQYVSDVTVPDGTNFEPNEAFVKTWRLQNTGTSTWTTDYDLVFADGAPMTTNTTVPLTQEVGPGQTIDVSVSMTAPADPGNYQSFWRLANAQGTPFGTVIYADINVVAGNSGTPAATGNPSAAGTSSATGTPVANTTPGATATGSAQGTGGTTVTQVTLTVNDADVQASCPYTFSFPASLTINKDTKVTYRLEAESSTQGVEITQPEPSTTNLSAGTHTFTYELSFSASVSGFARFHVTSPEDVASSEVSFSLTCN